MPDLASLADEHRAYNSSFSKQLQCRSCEVPYPCTIAILIMELVALREQFEYYRELHRYGD